MTPGRGRQAGTAKHVLFVGGRGHELGKVGKLGLRYSMVQIPERVSEQHAAAAAHFAVADYRNLAEILPVVRAWHGDDPFDAVVSFTEYGLEPASRCAIELGIPGDNLTAVLRTRDKIKTRELLDGHELGSVRYRVCQTLADARDFLRELAGQAIVLKPPSRGMSEGVFVVQAEEQLAERWGWTSLAADGPVLAEEYLSGPEYSVESVSRGAAHEVVMITEKLTTGFPGFVELGHQLPARLTRREWAEITALVIEFLGLIGQETGPVHSELRITPAGVRLIESQTRTGGDQIWEMCEMVSGVDMIAETLAALVDLPKPSRKPVADGAAIRFFGYENATVRDVRGVPDAERMPGVVRVACTLEPGQELGRLTSSESRQGYVLCQGSSASNAMARAEAARDLVQVVLAPSVSVPLG